jgi:hypothetical protein
VRNQTRKAEQSGLVPAPSGAARDRVAGFFAPFAVNMRDLGSPPHARRFYEAAAEAFGGSPVDPPGDARRAVGRRARGDRLRRDRDRSLGIDAARRARALPEQPDLLGGDPLGDRARGALCSISGRSPREGGTHRFKLGWGATERELSWIRLGREGEPTAASTSSPSRLAQRLALAWTRLPVGLATAIGSRLRPHLAN